MNVCVCVCVYIYIIINIKVYHKTFHQFSTNVVNFVPYRSEYTVPASNPVCLTPLFRTGKNTGCTGLVPAVPANFGQYRPV